MNPGPQETFYASPDPAPTLAPGRSLAFVLRDLPEDVPDPKKMRFDLHLTADAGNQVTESNEDNNSTVQGFGWKGPWAERFP
jgi:subtilase family serine protease